jgi:cytochrome c biogenesis protein CcmG/thiol:disulfide interchange protein DsbE
MLPNLTVRRQRRALSIALVGVVAVLAGACASGAGAGGGGTSPAPSVIQIGSPFVGKPAPALVGTTLDGAQFDLASLRGSPVLLNFWASWCGPCRDEFPILAAAEKAHAAQGLKVVGVLFKDDVGPAKEFAVAQNADWPTVADPTRAIGPAWGILAPPQTYFIDRNGVVRDVQIGQVRSAEELDGILAQITQ